MTVFNGKWIILKKRKLAEITVYSMPSGLF